MIVLTRRVTEPGSCAETGTVTLAVDSRIKSRLRVTLDDGRDVDLRDVPGFEPQTPIRWGNSAPGKAELPGGERTPRRNGPQKHARRPHSEAPRHAHAGPKKHSSGPRRDGGRTGGARQGQGQARPAR